jgi:hypothetical protein
MKKNASITIHLPVSLHRTLEAVTASQAITEEEAYRRIICGLVGLSDVDLRSLPEPPREYSRNFKIDLEWPYIDTLSEATNASGLTNSSLFRRIVFDFLITHTIHFVATDDENGFRLELAQKHFEYAEEYERDGPSPLITRPHRERFYGPF